MKFKPIIFIIIFLYLWMGCQSTRVALQTDRIRPVLEEKKDIAVQFVDSSRTEKRYLSGESYEFINDTLITPYNVYLSKPDTFKIPLNKIIRIEYKEFELATTILLGVAILLAGWLLLI